MAKTEKVDPQKHALLVRNVRHDVERLAAIVALTKEATVLLSHSRMVAEAACHFLMLESTGLLVQGANPRELVNELRRHTKGVRNLDDEILALLNSLVELGNFGSHFEPERDFSETTLTTARSAVTRVIEWLNKNVPGVQVTYNPEKQNLDGVEIASIRLSPNCLWWPAHRMRKLPEGVDLGFHEIPENGIADLAVGTEARSRDPILDIVVLNAGSTPRVVDRLGVVPIQIWTDLKGFAEAHVVRTQGSYTIDLGPLVEGQAQWLDLRDPVHVPSGASWRFEFQLKGFSEQLSGNESLVQLLVGAGSRELESIPIYMGRY